MTRLRLSFLNSSWSWNPTEKCTEFWNHQNSRNSTGPTRHWSQSSNAGVRSTSWVNLALWHWVWYRWLFIRDTPCTKDSPPHHVLDRLLSDHAWELGNLVEVDDTCPQHVCWCVYYFRFNMLCMVLTYFHCCFFCVIGNENGLRRNQKASRA